MRFLGTTRWYTLFMHRLLFIAVGFALLSACASPGQPPIVPSQMRTASSTVPATSAALDSAVKKYMAAHNIRAGQLAVVKNGKLLFSHAYTNSTNPQYPKTSTTSIMRIASESKSFSFLAGQQVVKDGLVSPSVAAFPYLKINKPLLKTQHPDPNINKITVSELLNLTSGLAGELPTYPDPDGPGPMRAAEIGAGNAGPLSIGQFNEYLYGYALVSVPGTTQNLFTNAGYYMIDRVVEKASGKPYWSYIQTKFLHPIGIRDAIQTHTALGRRHAKEVTYDSTITNLSVLAPRSNAMVPCPYGGNFLFEVVDSVSVALSTQSYAKFVDKYYSPNYKTSSYWTGFMCGTSSFTGFQAGHATYSFTFNNTVNEYSPSDPFVIQIAGLVNKIYH